MLFLFRIGSKPVLLAGSSLLLVFFSACSDRSDNELAVFKAMDESLINSNKTINKSTETLSALIEEKLMDPTTSYKAKIWQPKAALIRTLSSDMNAYLEKLKSDLKKEAGIVLENNKKLFDENNKAAVKRLFVTKNKGKLLYDELSEYKQNLLKIDSQMTQAFKKSIIIATVAFDTLDPKQQNMAKTFFDNTSVISAIALLSQLQNNVKNTENRMVQFCHSKIPSPEWFLDYYSAIVAQSSSYVKAGEMVEIYAGIGAFSKSVKPDIKINNKSVALGFDGVAVYKFKASDKTGKHFVPITINYTDHEGKKQLITKDIEYTVAKEMTKE